MFSEADEVRHRQESEKEDKFEGERKRRMEERRHQEEGAWAREQEALHQLRSEDKRRPPGHLTTAKEDKKKEVCDEETKEEESEDAMDPELRKYMDIVQKKRDEEKLQEVGEKTFFYVPRHRRHQSLVMPIQQTLAKVMSHVLKTGLRLIYIYMYI